MKKSAVTIALSAAAAMLLGAGAPQREGAVTFKGEPVTLEGQQIAVGQRAPGFALIDTALQPRTLEDYAGKIKVISTVPSLDTGVCSLQTHTFNKLAAEMGPDVVLITVSMDLPFAQKRWCEANAAENIVALSDYRDRQFARDYGLLMAHNKLLARAVILLDAENTVRYVQVVPEIANEPDYDAVLGALRALAGEAAVSLSPSKWGKT